MTSSSARVRELVKDSKSQGTRSSGSAFWTYATAEDVLREINGFAVRDNRRPPQERRSDPQGQRPRGRRFNLVRRMDLRRRLPGGGPVEARDSVTNPTVLVSSRLRMDPPDDMRILYNRASCDKEANPTRRKTHLWRDEKRSNGRNWTSPTSRS